MSNIEYLNSLARINYLNKIIPILFKELENSPNPPNPAEIDALVTEFNSLIILLRTKYNHVPLNFITPSKEQEMRVPANKSINHLLQITENIDKKYINLTLNSGRYIFQPKIDGISIIFWRIKNDIIPLTRGNGVSGECKIDFINHHLPHLIQRLKNCFDSIPICIGIRGELVFTTDRLPKTSTRRCELSGILNRKVLSEASNDIIFVVFDFYGSESSLLDNYATARACKLTVIPSIVKDIPNEISENSSFIDIILNEIKEDPGNEKSNIIYDVDGIIIRSVDNSKVVALKKLSLLRSRVIDLKWSKSAKGKLSPVIEIVPIQVENVCLKHIYGHSFSFMVEELIEIGDDIEFYYKGDSISTLHQNISHKTIDVDTYKNNLLEKIKETFPQVIEYDTNKISVAIAPLITFLTSVKVKGYNMNKIINIVMGLGLSKLAVHEFIYLIFNNGEAYGINCKDPKGGYRSVEGVKGPKVTEYIDGVKSAILTNSTDIPAYSLCFPNVTPSYVNSIIRTHVYTFDDNGHVITYSYQIPKSVTALKKTLFG